MDATTPPQLTDRQEKILALVVREYINRPEPVGSKYLSEQYLTHISSATIRNDLALLEELGYLASPHTSAGRIPTEAGYRYFVKRLLGEGELSAAEQKSIAQNFKHVASDIDQWMQLAVTTLARTTHGAALVTAPSAFSNQFKHIELIATQGRLVLMVLVLNGGEVRQQMLTLADAATQETLSAVAQRINLLCDGLAGLQIRKRTQVLDTALGREILEIVADVLTPHGHRQHVATYRDGLSDVLPEFTESEGAQQALRLMEDDSQLSTILAEVLDKEIGAVSVVIAGEGRWDSVRHLGIVLSRYGIHGQATGTLTVFGPTRMRYGRAISAVRYVSALMSNLLVNVYDPQAPTQNDRN